MIPDDIFVVDSTARARELLDILQANPGPFGVDCETVDCDPKKQSPVLTARIVCWSVAWFEDNVPKHPRANTGVARRAFIWAEFLPEFKAWLESNAPKVGASFTSYDMHCFENHGVRVGGLVHDNKHTSRMWYSSKDQPHDLKYQAEAVLGYHTRSYKQLFSRAKELKPKVYKKTTFYKAGTSRKGPLAGVPTLVCEGTVSKFSHRGKLPLIPLDRIREDYPTRVDDLLDYASNDAKFSLELMPHREAELASRPAKFGSTLKLYTDVWHPMLLQLNRMERTGICIDRDRCEQIRAKAQGDMDALLPGVCEFAADDAFNPGSPRQLAEFLFERLGLRRPPVGGTMFAIKATKPDEWSTSEASLHWLQIKHPEYNAGLDLIRRWRKIRRNMQFGRDIPKYVASDGRVHTVLSPEADTGRLSAKLPALQQIPSKNDKYGIRSAFVAAPGKLLVVADFSQLEVYVLAHMLIRLFGETSVAQALSSGDVYSWIARRCWSECAGYTDAQMKDPAVGKRFRDLAKILVLATNYGKTPMGLALSLLDELGEPADEDFCRGLLDTYMNTLPGVTMWQRWIAEYAKANRGVPTLLGRWRPLPLAGTNRGDRQALNSPIQGGAMDIAALGMLSLNTYDGVPFWFNHELAATEAQCLLQVHDELIFEVDEDRAPEALGIIEHGMTHPPLLDLAVQLKVEAHAARSWKEAK